MMSFMQDQGFKPRSEPRTKRPRPDYLSAESLNRAAENGEIRIIERVRRMRDECHQS